MAAEVNVVFASSHIHISITNKLQNDHHLELPDSTEQKSYNIKDIKKI